MHGDVVEVYHGTSLPFALKIMAEGFRPSATGAGGDSLHDTWKHTIPSVYFANTFSCALQYPIYGNTLPHARDRNGISCGFVPSMHPSAPVRVVFRCIARVGHRLWHRKADGWNAQSIFPYNALHITHVYFVGVSYDLVHRRFPFTALVPLQRCLRTAFLANPRAEPQPPAAAGRGHPEGQQPEAPAAFTVAVQRPLSQRRSFTTVEMRNILLHPRFSPDMPIGADAWTDLMADELLTADVDPEFGLHVKTERVQPWTGLGEWRSISADEVSDDLAQLLPRGV
jgi:hypothetical protein